MTTCYFTLCRYCISNNAIDSVPITADYIEGLEEWSEWICLKNHRGSKKKRDAAVKNGDHRICENPSG